jgi:hypothetical protein
MTFGISFSSRCNETISFALHYPVFRMRVDFLSALTPQEEFAAMEDSGSSGNVLEQGGRAIKDTAAEDEENRGAENMASSDSEISDIGEGQEGGMERWQKLLWKAIRFEHEVIITAL